MRKTNHTIRLLYAVAITLVVLGHCQGGSITPFAGWFPVYSYHLAIFAFCSGYLFHGDDTPLPRFLGRKALRLLVPLLAWNVAYGLAVCGLARLRFAIGTPELSVETLLIRPFTDGHQFVYNMGGWFVVSLFLIQALDACLRRLAARLGLEVGDWAWFAILAVPGVLGIWAASRGYNTGLWLILVRMAEFMPHYAAGELYARRLEQRDSVGNVAWFGGIFLVQLVVIAVLGGAPSFTPSWCNDFGNPLVVVLEGYLGTALWLRIARILEPVVRKSRLVEAVGSSTFSIMLHQFVGFMLVKAVFALLHTRFGLCEGFDVEAFRSDVWYFYLPRGMKQFLIVYAFAGIALPLAIQRLQDAVSSLFARPREEVPSGRHFAPATNRPSTTEDTRQGSPRATHLSRSPRR